MTTSSRSAPPFPDPRASRPTRRPGAAELLRPTFKRTIFHTYDNLGAFVLANLVWIALSIPIITAPAATAALFDLGRRAAGGEPVGVKQLGGAFRRHFVPALRLALFDLVVAALLWFNVDFYSHLGSWATLPGFLLAGLMIWVAGFWILMHAHLLPVLVGGERRFAHLLRKSALLTLDNLGYTIGVTVQALALLAISLLTGAGFLLVGGSLIAVLLSTGHRELLAKYAPPAPGEEDPAETRGLRDLFRPWEAPRTRR